MKQLIVLCAALATPASERRLVVAVILGLIALFVVEVIWLGTA